MGDTKAKLLRVSVPCTAIMLLAACGGGGGSSPDVITYQATSTAGSGGTITPASQTVGSGGSTTFTVTPNAGYVISGVTGCGGSLLGSTYTTGAVTASCTVTAAFSAAFTWVSGSNTTDASGVYGTQGVAAAANVPGSRDGGATWTDTNGNLWLFGGFTGYNSATNPATGNFMNDLWEYSPSKGEWTWVGGSNTACSQGVYGTEGVAAAANVPGARTATTTWTDSSGNIWLFGGGGCDSTGAFVLYGDLWKYSPASGLWTWAGGSTASYAAAVYGNQGVAAAANTPGSRAAQATWTDASGNLWLFGGFGYDTSTSTKLYLNDLWEYSPASGEWTWVGGPSTANTHGVYGTQGVAVVANVPGGRDGSYSWTDSKGNFWLFGGVGYDSTGQFGVLNDLWEYSPASNEWTWISGSNVIDATGVYGTQGTAAAANVPSARETMAVWPNAGGNAWIFGGYTFDDPTTVRHEMNDLWKYPTK